MIEHEAYDLFVNTPAQVDAHLNSFLGRDDFGVDDYGAGTVNATENWWGCFGGPGGEGCASVEGSGVLFTPWLRKPFLDK